VQKYQCITCHSVNAPTKLVGPSLYDIGKRQDTTYIRESILEPDKVVAEGFPQGLMKATLSGIGFYGEIQANPGIVDALVDYLASPNRQQPWSCPTSTSTMKNSTTS
jgi:cytochrome c551/c552